MRATILFFLLALAVALPADPSHAQDASQLAGDARLKIVSPAEGATLNAGQSVSITVSIDKAIKPQTFDINIPSVTIVPGEDYNGYSFSGNFTVPANAAGILTLIPEAMDDKNVFISGSPRNIVVRPPGALSALTITPTDYHLTALGQTLQMNVVGSYGSTTNIDYTSGLSGTRYDTSSYNVLSVDPDGLVRANGYGSAVVSATNGSLTAHATITVDDPAKMIPPDNVTDKIAMTPSAITFDQNGYYNQSILITNNLSYPLIGPLNLVATDLPNDVVLVNSARTVTMQPAGAQYVQLPLSGVAMPAHSVLNVGLQFVTQHRADIHYTPRIYRSAGP